MSCDDNVILMKRNINLLIIVKRIVKERADTIKIVTYETVKSYTYYHTIMFAISDNIIT